mgnify:CR=1 FL=1
MRIVLAHHPFLLNADDWFDHLPGLTAAYPLLSCFSGFYRTCRSCLCFSVYSTVWNHSVTVCGVL